METLVLPTTNHTNNGKILKFIVGLNCLRSQTIGTGANPRVQRETTPAFKAMIKTLENEPENFLIYNKGITIIATEVKYEDGVASIIYSETQGIVDGGHSHKAIQKTNQKEGQAEGEASITIIIATDEEAIEIAKSLNTQTAVTDQAIENQRGTFNWLKDSNLSQTHLDNIQMDGCTTPFTYKITEIYQMLAVTEYNTMSDVVIAYSSSRKTFNRMCAVDCSKFKHVLKEVVHAHEILEYIHLNDYNDSLKPMYTSRASNYQSWFNKSQYRLHGGIVNALMFAYSPWLWDTDEEGFYRLNRSSDEMQALLLGTIKTCIAGVKRICRNNDFSYNTAGKTESFYHEVKTLVDSKVRKFLNAK